MIPPIQIRFQRSYDIFVKIYYTSNLIYLSRVKNYHVALVKRSKCKLHLPNAYMRFAFSTNLEMADDILKHV